MSPTNTNVQGKKFWVVGLARSGCAAGALLRRQGATVLGIDDAAEEAVNSRWQREGLTNLAPEAFDELAMGGDWPSAASNEQLPAAVVISPGVPLDHPRLQELKNRVPIVGEMELAASFCQARIVAITGTNGKSTTTEMVAHLVRQAGLQAEALGNLGTPLSQVADTLSAEAVVSLEVSSFQLETVHDFSPEVALVLNLAPDHLDRYPDLQAYYSAKEKLAHLVPETGTYITWTQCPEAMAWKTSGERSLFGDHSAGAKAFFQDGFLLVDQDDQIQPLLPVRELALQSPPNLLNALAAVTVGMALGLDLKSMARGLRDFPGLAHRHQVVARQGDVRFINDTKATNVHAVCAGLDGYPDPVVLIAGGSGKGESYAPLREVMAAVRHVVLIGQEGPAIGEALDGVVPTTLATTMDEAVALAYELAQPEAAVLLSPACASFDMFSSYRKRGEAFVSAAVACGAQLMEYMNNGPRG